MSNTAARPRGLQPPAERKELADARVALELAQRHYEQARAGWRNLARIVVAMKDGEKEAKADACRRLVEGGKATKTDAPKLLHLDPQWETYQDQIITATLNRDEAEDDLSVARHRLNTASLILASYLPGLVLPLPGHNGVTQ